METCMVASYTSSRPFKFNCHLYKSTTTQIFVFYFQTSLQSVQRPNSRLHTIYKFWGHGLLIWASLRAKSKILKNLAGGGASIENINCFHEILNKMSQEGGGKDRGPPLCTHMVISIKIQEYELTMVYKCDIESLLWRC